MIQTRLSISIKLLHMFWNRIFLCKSFFGINRAFSFNRSNDTTKALNYSIVGWAHVFFQMTDCIFFLVTSPFYWKCSLSNSRRQAAIAEANADIYWEKTLSCRQKSCRRQFCITPRYFVSTQWYFGWNISLLWKIPLSTFISKTIDRKSMPSSNHI